MRMVSFADREVQRELSPQFVLLSTNMEGMRGAGRSVGHLPSDAPGLCPPRLAHQNCQVFFLTPRLEIFHAATGFLSPSDLAQEARFAEDLFAAIQKRPKAAAETVAAAHRGFLTKQGSPTATWPLRRIRPTVSWAMAGDSVCRWGGRGTA